MNEYFDLLWEIFGLPDLSKPMKYGRMRDLLERLCREQMRNENPQITDLSARINFLSAKFGLGRSEQNRLHTFRLNSTRILNGQIEMAEDCFLSDLKTLVYFVGKIYPP